MTNILSDETLFDPAQFLMNVAVVLVFCILTLAIVNVATALPTTGAATLIGSNNVTIPVTGVTGTDAWVVWGNNPGGYSWNTANYTPTAGTANVLVWGAPLMGNTLYYAKGCDNTGCGAEISFSTAAITPLPTTTFGAGYNNLTASHFNVLYIAPMIEGVYSPQIPRTMLFGILIGLIFLGLWMRTRSIRICASLGLMLGSLMFYPNAGLYLGIPGSMQLLGGILLSSGLAGWVLALWLKK